MKKLFYGIGSFFGIGLVGYLLMLIYMVSTKSENITAFAIIGAIVPLICGMGSIIWLIMFLSYLSTNQVQLKQYKLPFICIVSSLTFIMGSILFIRLFGR